MFRRVLIIILLSVSMATFAQDFVVRHIQVQGLQRISNNTVLTEIPLHVGQTYTDAEGNAIIAALFKTGFFSDVQLKQSGNTLIVQVVERPTIGSITITGNQSIKTSQLKPILNKMNIVVGDTFDPSELHAIVLGLQQQYALEGHAGAAVIPSVTKMSRNRVAINILIQEGKATVVRDIHITGNHAFSDRLLRDQFKLTTPSVFTWFNHNDRYSKMRLDNDLQHLQNFYYDHGYLDFQIVSHRISELPHSQGVAIDVHVHEGSVYHISNVQLSAPQLSEKLKPAIQNYLLSLKPGDVFSRKQILAINKQVGTYLADQGYAFPVINPVPTIDHINHQVAITYNITSGQRVYVRKVHIIGNTRTSGTVIRSEMRQMEGAPYSLKDVNESKRLMQNLGYINQVHVTSKPVPNTNDQVDLNYHVHEVNAGRASIQGGYSDQDGFLYGASISEPNFMGSGRYVSIGFTRSAYTSNYNFNYNNPFYTNTGVSRGFGIYYNHTTPANVNLEPYTSDDFGTNINWGIPISENDQVSVGMGYDHTAISNVSPSLVSPSVTSFMNANPSPYNQFKLISGVSHVTLDRSIFPNIGNTQSLSGTLGVPVLNSSLSYYQATYAGQWYFPIHRGFIFDPHVTLGYGGGYGSVGTLPFFNNYYAGGIQTLPGFLSNTLGPKNPVNTGQALGGNLETLGGLNFILPDFISRKVRTAAIIDAGNIFQTTHTSGISYESVSLNNLRVTAGIMVSWWSPLGAPLDFSLAFPLNKKAGDQLSPFGFSFGAAI